MNKPPHPYAVYAARVALVIAGSFAAAGAKDARTELTVGATVRAVANMELQSVPLSLNLTQADIARGYIDVDQPTRLMVRSNSQSGYELEFQTVLPVLRSLIVRGLESEQSLGAEGGTVVQRWQGPHVAALSLKYRLALAPGVTAGGYPWPVRLAVRPL